MPRLTVEIPDYIETDEDWLDILVELLESANIPAHVDYAEEDYELVRD